MKKYITLIALITLVQLNFAQTAVNGEVIKNFGKTYSVENPTFKTDTTSIHKVVFDVNRNFDDPSRPNPLIESAARYLNMHEKAGVPIQNMYVALVFHGDAANDVLSKEVYAQRSGYADEINPNVELLSALAEKNVQLILCGQTAANREITKNDLHKDVDLALSAMTALVQLQSRGYRLIQF